ncbi:hypothetical protein KR038_007457, partial [Drosophila bunnanda]
GPNAKKPSKSTPTMNPTAQPEFIVEKITGKRYWNGRPQVQIKWKGYPPEENTWEPMENIGNCMVLLADFEAELYKRRERKRLQKAVGKNKPSSSGSKTSGKHSGDAAGHKERQVEIGKATGPKANLTNCAIGTTPKPNASLMVNPNKKLSHMGLVKGPKKMDPSPFLLLSDSSDNEDLLQPSKRRTAEAVPQSSSDGNDISEILLCGSSSSQFSDSQSLSDLTKGTIVLNPQKQAAKNAASLKTKKTSVPLHNTVSKKIKLNQIHSNSTATPISPPASSLQLSKQFEEKSQIDQTPISSKKNKMSSPKKGKIKESDNDSDMPSMSPNTRHSKLHPNAEASDWKMPLRKTPFGLARGLELDKIVHNIKVAGKLFLFVNWKGNSAPDVVSLDELKVAYPAKVIEYFEQMKRITED